MKIYRNYPYKIKILNQTDNVFYYIVILLLICVALIDATKKEKLSSLSGTFTLFSHSAEPRKYPVHETPF